MTDFRTRIRASLASEALQIALDNNAERRNKGRLLAFESLPDWRARRQQAHALRADVIEHLEEYLVRFVNKAGQNGIIVHRAQDGTEAIRIILEIVKNSTQRNPKVLNPFENSVSIREIRGEDYPEGKTADSETSFKTLSQDKLRDTKDSFAPLREENILIAKSKSMVSEEIDLNQGLEAAGLRVVETDLGEYIVQLRRERPGHILTPAVHLRRNDVGQLFHEKLGIPYTDDIPTLTDTARQLLRDVFLTADVGISGVNFGIVDTGGICLVSNEGNARMVTTLPPLHIALMGIERLVRSLDDLAVMMSLLPRAATGQKLSVYTQVIHAPFPGQQRHLVLLDNGRAGIRNSPLRESLYCIRCGSCLNACPVFREIGGHAYDSPYSGPIGSVISAGFFGSDFVPLAQASSLCGACKEACPVDIDLPKLLTRVRAGQLPGTHSQSPTTGALSRLSALFLRIYSRLARSPRLFALSQRLAALATRLLSPFSDYVRLPAFTGWGYSKDLPRFAAKPFRARFQREPAQDAQISTRERVGASHVAPLRDLSSSAAGSDRVAQFIEELTKVNGSVTRTGPEAVTGKIIEFLRSRRADSIHLEPGVLDEPELEAAGIAVRRASDAATPVGVTKVVCGLADTGSILLADGEGNPLQASLLPRIHVAVLRASDILPSLANALTLPAVRESCSAVVITGPSRTADIEMSLTIGMHGPGELQVFLVDD